MNTNRISVKLQIPLVRSVLRDCLHAKGWLMVHILSQTNYGCKTTFSVTKTEPYKPRNVQPHNISIQDSTFVQILWILVRNIKPSLITFPWTKYKSFISNVSLLITLVFLLTVDVPQYCPVHRNEVIQDPDNCAKFYNCSDVSHSECTYPDLFSLVTFRCERFLSTSCDQRPEPQAPCNVIILFFLLLQRKTFINIMKGVNHQLQHTCIFIMITCLKKSKDKSIFTF